MARKTTRKAIGDARDPEGLVHWTNEFIDYMRVRNYSQPTLVTTESALRLFNEWAHERGLRHPNEVSKPILESYQRWLFYYRRKTGKPLTFSSQRVRLQKLRGFFKWLTKSNVIDLNPAGELELPRIERRIPRAIFNEREVEKVLAQPDVTDVFGLRDRAMMEVLYSTGIRRHELANLELFDIDTERGTLTVRLGKGRKDRVVPIGERALGWIAKYLEAARPKLVAPPENTLVFLNERGDRFVLPQLTHLMRRYIDDAKVGKKGACHIFRHTMATLMLEGGADVRHIQEILGHVETSTTAIYTRVSIQHLKRIHDATHPAAKASPRDPVSGPAEAPGRDEASAATLLSSLAAEAAEEASAGGSFGG
jgi:integrase/recombinase XerD